MQPESQEIHRLGGHTWKLRQKYGIFFVYPAKSIKSLTKQDKEELSFSPQSTKLDLVLVVNIQKVPFEFAEKLQDITILMAASIGFQFGAQAKTVILAFTQKNALNNFQNSDGWKVGDDGSVALVTLGAGDSLNTVNIKDPIVGFVFGQKGLMYNLTFEGSKYTR